MSRPDRAPIANWLHPKKYPPPRGVKLNLLTRGGVAVYGSWAVDSVAWAPLLQVTHPDIKADLAAHAVGRKV